MPVVQIKAHLKVKLKIEQIARMRLRGITDGKICELLGLSRPGLSRILRLAEYKDHEDTLLTGYVSREDEALAQDQAAMREHFKKAVPAAMRALMDAVVQRRDLKASLSAAKEILDRDPQKTLVNTAKMATESESPASQVPDALLANAVSEANKVAASIKQRSADSQPAIGVPPAKGVN